MNSIELLFSLIASMTKSEKRYFRMTTDIQGGKKNYLLLFDLLESHKTFDEALKKQVSKSFPGLSIEPTRKHLYRVLIKSLRQYENENTVDSRLLNLIEDSRILYKKGILSLSLEQLAKAKELALRHEKYLHYIIAARQEMHYLMRSQFVGITEIELVEKQQKIKEFLEHEATASQHGALYEVLLFRYWKKGVSRNEKDVLKLNDLLLEEYQIINTQRLKSFESQKLHLYFQSIYFMMSNNHESSLQVFRDLDELYLSNEHLWKENPAQYVQLIDGILYDLRLMKRYEEMEFYFHRLKGIKSESEGLTVVLRYNILDHQLQALCDQKRTKEALSLIEESQPSLSKEITQLNLQTRTQLQFSIVRIFFLAKDYRKALKQIIVILNLSEASLQARLYVSCRILYLQINASLGNYDHLLYAIRSIERKLRSARKMFGAEKLVISFLKRWINMKPVTDLKEQLEILKGNPFENQLVKELFIEEWIEEVTKAPTHNKSYHPTNI